MNVTPLKPDSILDFPFTIEEECGIRRKAAGWDGSGNAEKFMSSIGFSEAQGYDLWGFFGAELGPGRGSLRDHARCGYEDPSRLRASS
ncbi:MAG: hypothetical protein IPK68_23135 [Bdellovibrionales bacterium]|nr:hypothetical protein [Bdellovibrionales bacterium]